MGIYPEDLRYTKDHEWAKRAGSAIVIGVTFHAQDALGSLVFVELPPVGTVVAAGKSFGVIESTKAVSELFAPVGGTVSKVNEALTADPSAVNSDPYAAWIIEIEPNDPKEFESLLDRESYLRLVEAAR